MDDQLLVLRMQIICLVLGAMSISSVRRQKTLSASLFDQRRLRRSVVRSSRVNVDNALYSQVPQQNPSSSESSASCKSDAENNLDSNSGISRIELV